MGLITYSTDIASKIAVYLDGRRVGIITKKWDGWHYQPKGTKLFGKAFPTLTDCKRSLETT
jgi:hypothetical protein